MINNSATSTNENVDAPLQLECLVVNARATVHSENIVLIWVQFKSLQLFSYLKGELSRGGQNHCLRLSLSKEAFAAEANNHGQTEAESLSRPSKVSYNQVFFIKNSPESAVLNWEKFCDATIRQALNCSRVKFRKVREVTRIVGSVRFCRLRSEHVRLI